MINFLSSWVKNLALALIIVSILEMILPNNKTKKYVKMIMWLYILFSIISPFIENSNKFNFDDLVYENYIEKVSSIDTNVNQNSMDNRLSEIYKEQLEKDIIQKIEKKGYEVEKCKVIAQINENDSEIQNITLKIKAKIATEENNNAENKTELEDKIVTEIQKIQKVEVGISKNNDEKENANVTKTDIKIIKQFLIDEYGVNEECLKIS